MTTSVVMEKNLKFFNYHLLGFQIPFLSNESNISGESRILDDEPLGTIFERKEKPLLITHTHTFFRLECEEDKTHTVWNYVNAVLSVGTNL